MTQGKSLLSQRKEISCKMSQGGGRASKSCECACLCGGSAAPGPASAMALNQSRKHALPPRGQEIENSLGGLTLIFHSMLTAQTFRQNICLYHINGVMSEERAYI